MLKPELIANLGQQLLDLVPDQVSTAKRDIEKNIQAVLQNTFSKLDLVSREEFDAQTAVLQRTREKLEAMEKQIELLEQAAKQSTKQPTKQSSEQPTKQPSKRKPRKTTTKQGSEN